MEKHITSIDNAPKHIQEKVKKLQELFDAKRDILQQLPTLESPITLNDFIMIMFSQERSSLPTPPATITIDVTKLTDPFLFYKNMV